MVKSVSRVVISLIGIVLSVMSLTVLRKKDPVAARKALILGSLCTVASNVLGIDDDEEVEKES